MVFSEEEGGKMKKSFLGTILIVLLLSVFTGCSAEKSQSDVLIRIGSLKGPTSIGLMKLMNDSNEGKSLGKYSFEIATTADEILPKMISKELDIALVPSNVASVLYNKTKGAVKVIDINTLGVLYAVSQDEAIASINDLKGKRILVTNKGTTPDYVLQYLLNQNNISLDEVNIEYKSEAQEVAALLKEDGASVGILPQPFATACSISNEELNVVLDLNKEWETAPKNDDSMLVTGVTVVRTEFLLDNKDAVDTFLKEHEASAKFVETNPDETAKMVVDAKIIEKEPLAKAAIPKCNVTFITKDEMKANLKGYLEVLFNLNPESVGGSLPDEDFYY